MMMPRIYILLLFPTMAVCFGGTTGCGKSRPVAQVRDTRVPGVDDCGTREEVVERAVVSA